MKGKRKIDEGIVMSGMILIVCILSISYVNGQEPDGDLSFPVGQQFKERLSLYTDRTTYIAGENILFTLFNCSPQSLKDLEWSKVLYVELLSSGNEPVIQEKYKLSPGGVHGALDISRSTVSGIYYLRAYTRWMRNYPVENFAYQRIRIINPYSPEISETSEADRGEGFIPMPHSSDSGVALLADLHTDREIYNNREVVEITGNILVPEQDSLSGICMSVVRKTVLDSLNDLSFLPSVNGVKSTFFVPETRGMALFGKVVDKAKQVPVPYSRVHLTLIGEKNEYIGYQTGTDGNFYIPLKDYTGNRDFYISAETDWEDETEILIDQDFSTRHIVFRQDKFEIRDRERPVLQEMIVNARVSDLYGSAVPRKESAAEIIEAPRELNFYGKPWFTLRIDDYVKLPTLGEFIFELVPQAGIHRRKGKPSLRIYGKYGNLLIFEPLILLDHVAITDVSSILRLSPEKIESIELINATYIYGNIKYGGILSIVSREHDLAGVDLPHNSYFFEFRTVSDPVETCFREYESDKGDSRNPDFRNCLYWEPDLRIDETGRFRGKFYTSDRKGEYVVVVRGSTSGGKEIYGRTGILVQ